MTSPVCHFPAVHLDDNRASRYPSDALCGCSSVVERFLAKEEVVGSNPIARSVKLSAFSSQPSAQRVQRDVPAEGWSLKADDLCGDVAKW